MDLGRERGSIILTPNKSYIEWGSIFGDLIIATVVLDRLLHHFSAISICEKSYRLEKRRKTGPDPSTRSTTRRTDGSGSPQPHETIQVFMGFVRHE